jgi:hypothetical protein
MLNIVPLLRGDTFFAPFHEFHATAGDRKMDEQKIREAAYRLWEKQGKPQGQDLEHWFTAEQSEGESSSQMTPDGDQSNSSAGNTASSGKTKNKNGR